MTVDEQVRTRGDWVIGQYKNGASTNQIADELGVNSYYIWNFLKDSGVEVRKRQKFEGRIEDHVDNLLKMANAGMSAYKISKEIGISKPTVLRILKKNGFDTSKKRTRKKDVLLKDISDKVLELHNTGISWHQIAKEVGYSPSNVWMLLTKLGQKPPEPELHCVDETFFEQINTQEKAYILGIFYADGNVSKERNTIRIGLQEGDVDILEKMKVVLQYSGPIREAKQKKGSVKRQLSLDIYRKVICDQLIKLGCVPAKSNIVQFPTEDIVPKDLMSHFLRGFFDGDGSICHNSHSRGVSFTSSHAFINGLSKLLNDMGVYHNIYCYRNAKYTSTIQVNRMDDMAKITDFLYKDATIYMDRKYAKYQEFKSWYATKLDGKQKREAINNKKTKSRLQVD